MNEDIKNWNEFAWESAFKDEDSAISVYMRELPKFIDLPDEEDILFRQVQRLRKKSGEISFLSESSPEESDFDDEWRLPDDWEKRKGADIYRGILDLAESWCRIYASLLADDALPPGLRGISYYGMILFRIICVMETPDDLPSLSVAHCKRMVFAVNEMAGCISEIRKIQPELNPKLQEHISRLFIYREKMIEVMCALREKK